MQYPETTSSVEPRWQSLLINALRFALAFVFLFSGFVKATDPAGTVIKLTEYADLFGLSSLATPRLLLWGARLLCLAEFLPAVCLLFGIHCRKSLVWLLAFLCVMTLLTFYLALANPISDCGCFGDAVKLTNWQTFAKNLVLLAMVIPVLINSEMVVRLVSPSLQWVVVVFAVVSLLVYMQWNVRHLPAIDFRPYHVGADIRSGMSIPDDAEQPEYETLFTLEREGETQEFTAQDYPYADTTWHFVSSHTRLLREGYVPAIQGFELVDEADGTDVTDDVLDADYAWLVVMPSLDDESTLDIINDLYDYSQLYGYPFYALTSATHDDIDRWRTDTGARYPFCLLDETVLTTIVRSNPGLVLLKQGVVAAKWSRHDLPDDTVLDDSLDRLPSLLTTRRDLSHRYLTLFVWMFFPYLFLPLLERLVRRKEKKESQSF